MTVSSSFSPLPSKMTIAKAVALVTGAAQGIGHAIALRLAADGYDIALNDLPAQEAVLRVTAEEIASRRRHVHCVLADMVANAGIFLMKSFVENLDRIIGVNLRGTFLCYKYAGLQMIAQGRGGHIIGACSGSGKQGYTALSTYSSSKFGIRALTHTIYARILFTHIGISGLIFAKQYGLDIIRKAQEIRLYPGSWHPRKWQTTLSQLLAQLLTNTSTGGGLTIDDWRLL
ncbi:short chain oxidoreductase [Russula emetica]|nr:short chain oxidoreductase [Russula emetica]